MIDVHYWPTPNGKKVTILLEELGIPYNIVPVRIGVGCPIQRIDRTEDRVGARIDQVDVGEVPARVAQANLA